MKWLVFVAVAAAGCGGANSPGENCTDVVCSVGTSTYKFCSNPDMTSCHYLASDGSVFMCAGCNDCSQTAQSVSS